MIDNTLNIIESQSPFIQGLLAAAIFAFASWLFRFLKKRAQRTGAKFLKNYERLEVTKHYIYKNYVKGDSIQAVDHGINIVMFQSYRFTILAFLVLIMFFGIDSMLKGDWLYLAASWFSFNLLYEGYTWLKDKSDKSVIEYISDDVKEEFYSNLSPEAPEATSTKKIES